jgi:hypothetical protein
MNKKAATAAGSVVLILALASIACIGADSESIGSGPEFEAPYGIAVEAGGSLVMVDAALEAVVRVDPVSGDRTILSDASIGSGPGFITPVGIAVEADGSLVVVDAALEAVVRVDAVSGDRTILSDASIGGGPGLAASLGIAVEANCSLVVDSYLEWYERRLPDSTLSSMIDSEPILYCISQDGMNTECPIFVFMPYVGPHIDMRPSTTSGSRTFDNVLRITWTPAEDKKEVEISFEFAVDPPGKIKLIGNSTGEYHYDDHNNRVDAELQATFFVDGTGALGAVNLTWNINGVSGEFSGQIGTW